jgi:hypothetical protein
MARHQASGRRQRLRVPSMKNQEDGCLSGVEGNKALGLKHRRAPQQILVERRGSRDIVSIQSGL